MKDRGLITMSLREVDRFKVIQALADAYLKTGIAASRLGLTSRQTLRLLRRYQQDGAAGLLNRHHGQLADNRTPPGLAARALGLIRDSYADCARPRSHGTQFPAPHIECSGYPVRAPTVATATVVIKSYLCHWRAELRARLQFLRH